MVEEDVMAGDVDIGIYLIPRVLSLLAHTNPLGPQDAPGIAGGQEVGANRDSGVGSGIAQPQQAFSLLVSHKLNERVC